MKIRSLRAFGLALALGTMPAAALAQDMPAPAGEAPAAAQDISPEKLRSFAVAFLEVDRINQEYAPQLQAAASADEQQQIRQEAATRMIEAVENTDGISADEYTSILVAAQSNPELATQLNEAIGEAVR